MLLTDDWFDLQTQDRPRLCTHPPTAMETLVEIFNEACLSHPHIPHIFDIPRLITHMWRRQLSKEADFLFNINVGPSFWPCFMHELLIVFIVLPLAHVSNYKSPWVLRESSPNLEAQDHLEARFKNPELHGCGKFHDLEGLDNSPVSPRDLCSLKHKPGAKTLTR